MVLKEVDCFRNEISESIQKLKNFWCEGTLVPYKFSPPDYTLIYAALEIILPYLFPFKQIIYKPYTYIGIIFLVVGVLLNYFSYLYFKKAKNTMDPYSEQNKLITSGVYSFGRNPMYFGILLILIGEAILLGNIICFVIPVIFFILISSVTIPVEEKSMEKKFGQKYLDYKKKVRRWV
jgi:protein-S-isoprenylcysteine O-methyltransferase Ste14